MADRLRYLPKWLFFGLFVKPLVLFLLGLNVRGRQYLPDQGGAIIAANHNSHLDTLVLMSLFPLSVIHRIRPVAAADYFFKNRYLAWFARYCIGIIALKREGFQRPEQLFAECHQALDNGEILIIFPEGSRGKPEQLGKIKKGLYYLHKQRQHPPPITPVILRGLGNALPKGEALFVPFNCDVIIGNSLSPSTDCAAFMEKLQQTYRQLSDQCLTK
ncbi:MAG: 1-acyl-sn-glycerol-3-phosphate acyltransferase [Gammaproteobacteria bacterium]|nr:MAG: 1-acyl-sn-glycerol-3-phosphate acyltransferase [Gammaproteobacteria bacterium]